MVKRVNNSIISIFLLILSAFPFLFTFLLQAKKSTIHHSMIRKLETGFFQTITVKKENVHWLKKGKEILVYGRMFDIKSLTLQNGFYTFTGLYDDEETALLEQIRKNHQNNSPINKELVQLFQLLHSQYSDPTFDEPFVPLQTSKYLTIISPRLPSRFISKYKPPPQA